MATVQEPTRAAGRHESFVAAQIDRATRRIRGHDVGIATLGLVAGLLAYTLGMILLDRWLVLPAIIRQAACGLAFAAAIAYAAIILSGPFRRTINPFYAARQVERTIPGAKNSVVNWLDLHESNLPPAIRQALSHKAANDLDHADIDAAVRDHRMIWLGSLAGALGLAALIMLLILRPGPFFSLLGRNLAPFAFTTTEIAKQTQLEIVQPAAGDVTVSVHRSVEFRVAVGGRVPSPDAADAVRLQWKYNPSDPVWEEQRFEPTARDPREFELRVPAVKVQNGFVYRVAGGDDLTAEHRVSVRSTPLIESFEVTYHFRPYLRFEDVSTTNPNLEGLRGTEVTLIATTNRNVRLGGLHLIAGQSANRDPVAERTKPPETLSIPGEILTEKPNALRFRFTLEKDAHYTITFAATDGEENDRDNLTPFLVKVLSDQPPQVDITRPSADPLPLNGALEVEGKASDDFGLTKMRLCLQAKDDAKAGKAQPLAAKPYRPEKSFQFPDGTFPRALDYKDFLKLDELRTPLGARVEPKAGMVIEYWLEAEDNCDYPKANVGRSKSHTVTLAATQQQTPQEKQEQEQQVRDAKSAHDQQQDQAHEQEAAGKQPQKPTGDPNQGANNQQKPQENPANADQQQPPQQPQDPLEKKAEEIKKKLEQRDQQQGGGGQDGQPQQGNEPKGQSKGAQPNAGDGANDPQKSPPAEARGDPNAAQPPQPGAEQKGTGKDEGQKDQPPNPGASKPQPNQGGADQQPRPNQGQGDQGSAKPQPQGGSDSAGQSKPQPQQGPEPGAAKDNQQPAAPQPQPNSAKSDANKAGGPNEKTNPAAGSQDKSDTNTKQSATKDKQSAPKSQPNNSDANKAGGPNEKANPSGGSKDKNGAAGKTGQQKDGPQKSVSQKDSGNKQTAGKGQTGNEQPNQAPKNSESKDALKASSGAQKNGDQGKAGTKGSGQSSPGQPGAGQEQPMTSPDQAGDSKPEPGAAKGPDANEKAVAKGNPDSGSGDATGQQQPGAAKPDAQGQAQQKPGSNSSPDAKGGAGEKGKAGTAEKSKTGAGEKGKTGAGEKGNSQSKDDARSAAEEISKLAQDLASGDPKAREDARRRLEELRDAARDPQTRQDAQEALKQNQNANPQQGPKPGDQDTGKTPGVGEPTPKAGDLNGRPQADAKGPGTPKAAGNQKPSNPDARTGAGPKSSSKSGQDEGAPSPGGAGRDPAQADPNQKEAGNAGTGAPSATRHSPGDSSPAGPAEGEGSAPNAAHASKSGDLQLEDFKKVDKKLLDDMKMTPQEWDAFQKAYAERLKQKTAPGAGENQRGGTAGRSAANTGPRRVQGGTDKQNPLERGSIIQPPAEYRDGYRGFTEDLSKSPPPKKDQK
ncbi:MAG TPA: DUF4175 family protein [Gemmataceae bacterium]|nr:DUF4175 family protein [Gemmataceae bacterium]